MITREPTLGDVTALYDCIMPYAGQSWQGREVAIDPQMVVQSLVNVIAAGNFVKRLVEIDGQVVGLAFGYYCHSWWSEPDCAVDFLYADKRGAGVGRALVAALVMEFKARGCGWMYAGAESAVSATNSRLYENLFRKFGFRDIGGGRMILNLRGK